MPMKYEQVVDQQRWGGEPAKEARPDARTGRTWRPFFTLRTWRAGRSCRTDRTRIALGTLRSRWTCIALRTLAASGQAGERQCRRQCRHQVRHAHRHVLLERATPYRRLEDQTRQPGARRTLAVAERFV